MQHKKETSQVSGRDRLETAVKDLAEVVRSLHQLLQSYGPTWYTGETDARLRNALAEADSALRSSIIQRGRYRNPRREDVATLLAIVGDRSRGDGHRTSGAKD